MKLSFGKTLLLLCSFSAIVLFAGAGLYDLSSGDETRVAGIAAEMLVENDWIVPRLNGNPFLEYPPLYYWCTACSLKLFGIHDFAAKLPSVLTAFGCVILAFFFARKLKFSLMTSAASGILLLCCAQFFSESRTCRVDMLLAFFIQFSLFSFYSFTQSETKRGKTADWLFFVLGLTGTIYCKGLVGGAVVAGTLGPWLILRDIFGKHFSWRSYLAAFSGGVIALALTGLWYYAIFRTGGEKMFHTAFWVNNLGRFSGTQGDHNEGFFYYFLKLPELFVPMMPVLLWGLWSAFRRIRREKELLYLFCAVLFPFLLFCCASAKRTVYLQCITLPCVLLTAWQLAHLPETWVAFLRRKISLPPKYLIIGGLLLLAVILFTADIILSGKKRGEESLRSLFDYCREQQKQGKIITLNNGLERTAGAAYFYLQQRVPVRQGVIGENECRIFRSRKPPEGVMNFADYHFVQCGAPGRK